MSLQSSWMTRFVVLAFTAFLGLSFAQTRVEFWTFIDPAGDSVRSQALNHIIETFEAENPDVIIVPQIVQWQEISPSLLRAVRANRAPDLVMLFSPFLPLQVQAGSLRPLTPYINDLPAEERDDFVMPWSATSYDGDIFAAFYELRTSATLYRQDIFQELGLTVPATLEEMTEVAQALRDAGYIGFTIGVGTRNPSGFMEWFIPALAGLDVAIINEDGTAAFNTEEAERLVQWVYDAVHEYEITPLDVALQGSDEVEQLFDAGRTALMPKMTHRLEAIRERSGFGDDVQPMPVLTLGGIAPALAQGWTLAIPRGTQDADADAAWRFMRHWLSPEMQLHQSQLAGYIPVRQSTLEDPWFETSDAAAIRWAVEYAAEHPFEYDLPANTEQLYDIFSRMFEQVLANRMTPAEGLQWAEREFNRAQR